MSRQDRRLLIQQMTAAARVARYPFVKDAMAVGYGRSLPYTPCIGAHDTNAAFMEKFDPANPSELLYDGTDPDSRIVGLSYLNYADVEPSFFAGPNDHWHAHAGRFCRDDKGAVIRGVRRGCDGRTMCESRILALPQTT